MATPDPLIISPDAHALRAQLRSWFELPLGRSLQIIEAHCLRALWPSLYGHVALQVGHMGPVDLMEACTAATRLVLDLPGFSAQPTTSAVHAAADALPLDSRSVDLVLLPHTLEFSIDPHLVLREVQRVLTPEGHVVILGFNPLSLWGLWRLALGRRGRAPWCGHFIHLVRIKDWLKLLDFRLVQGTMLYYRPPLNNETFMDRLRFLDQTGNRWWPMAGAVYVMVAKKQVLAMTPLRPAWRTRSVLGAGLAQPARRVIPFPKVQWRNRGSG